MHPECVCRAKSVTDLLFISDGHIANSITDMLAQLMKNTELPD